MNDEPKPKPIPPMPTPDNTVFRHVASPTERAFLWCLVATAIILNLYLVALFVKLVADLLGVCNE